MTPTPKNNLLLLILSASSLLPAQVPTEVPAVIPGAKPVAVEHIKIHGTSLENNLEKDAVDRDVLVFLPPTYATEKRRRYPVVYALHGYSIGAEQWSKEIHVPQTIEGAFAQGAKDMIVVLPDSKTLHNGSMYSSSVTTGDFEKFISHDVVAYIDAHYRTIPNRNSRGLVGHSMGGYGATRIGMKHSDVFGSLYIMSPCCLSARAAGLADLEKAVQDAKSPEDLAKLPFMLRAQLASAAAWSPNPNNPPLYLDLPTKDGAPQPAVLAKWAANAPLAFIDQYVGNLREYHAISIDVGDQDGLRIDTTKLHEILDQYGITNAFEIYKGTHTSAVADRFQNHVLPFFSKNLSFETTWTAAQDHQNMLDQLGIKALRPGPSGNEADANHANYGESKANPYGPLPDALTLKNGQKVTTAAQWWNQRRPEIVEDFEREVIGRIPPNVPKVSWTVKSSTHSKSGVFPVIEKELIGHVDNSADPQLNVDIQVTLVTPDMATPDNSQAPAPVMIMFSSSMMRQFMASHPELKKMLGPDPPSTEQLIAGGWGYALLDTSSVQADNGAGLTSGIIGLTNQCQPRKPDDWGALRAWAWGASRTLDYLETDASVDAKRVGIEGVSRYGKAALVTMAFDTRFAVALVGSSGEGGAKPHRRNFGEAVENLTGSGEYHWMAGNFLKYGASQSPFGNMDASNLPVDANELIALCAPRLTFISYGIPEKGDAKWLDQQGSFMATVAAGSVFRLLGANDLGLGDDYQTAKMPPVNTDLLNGQLAWRQHDAGHTDAPNWKYFILWADRLLKFQHTAWQLPADQPVFRTDPNSLVYHAQLLAKAQQGGIDIYFEGDSITRRWGATDYPELLANWHQNFSSWHVADFGWGADQTQNILWRLENGELDGVNPKVVVLLAGTNNIGSKSATAGDVTHGVEAIVRTIQAKAPAAVIILTAIFPRNDDMRLIPIIDQTNANLSKLADGHKVRYLNINSKLATSDGKLLDGMMNADKLHPSVKAYQVWADALKPLISEVLGSAN